MDDTQKIRVRGAGDRAEDTSTVDTTGPQPGHAKPDEATARLPIAKSYKIYIGGKFPRTESGRYYALARDGGPVIANVCRSSRKDFREAVVAARQAFGAWSGASAYLRGQILYRIGEMLEGRSEQFVAELALQGLSKRRAQTEVLAAIDRLVIAGGNTCVVLASHSLPLCGVSFAEVLHASDVPPGVVNVLTGSAEELAEHFASHMDVNAVVYCDGEGEFARKIGHLATNNIKRVISRVGTNWSSASSQGPYFIKDTQETKTTWHPIGA